MGQGEVTPRSIFIPITVAWFFTPTRRVDTVFAEARDFSEIPRAAAMMEEILRDRHHQGSVFRVKTMTTVIRVARAISFGLIVAFILAAAVSVVVGGVGIMNILLASVEQRTREIGLRMSVGARRRDILQQFLLEALLLGVVGAVGRRPRRARAAARGAPRLPQGPDRDLASLRRPGFRFLLRRGAALRRRPGLPRRQPEPNGGAAP